LAGKRAVFLDRDDTIMADVVYCKDPEDVRLLPGAAEGIRSLADAGFMIVIATNQSGLGRGLFTEEELRAVNDQLRVELRARGADYDALYYCPHRPEDGCDCRKPKPGLLLRAASILGVDLHSSYCIGDRSWDVEAGHPDYDQPDSGDHRNSPRSRGERLERGRSYHSSSAGA
jgi:histidinol-phosphate phosphatase family protein